MKPETPDSKSHPTLTRLLFALAGTSNFFSLSGVGIRDSSRRPLAESLIKLKKHFGEAAEGAWAETEIKGKYVTRATPAPERARGVLPLGWRAIDAVEKVHALSRDIGLLMDKFRPLIFVISIDKHELIRTGQPTNPIGLGYTYLHQRIALTMEDLYAGEGAIDVAYQQSQHERLHPDGAVHEIRRGLGAGLYRQPNYNFVLDKPLWIDTDLSSRPTRPQVPQYVGRGDLSDREYRNLHRDYRARARRSTYRARLPVGRTTPPTSPSTPHLEASPGGESPFTPIPHRSQNSRIPRRARRARGVRDVIGMHEHLGSLAGHSIIRMSPWLVATRTHSHPNHQERN